MDPDAKNRVEQAVPKPEAVKKMSEEEKKALEASGDIEHAHGTEKERLAEKAQKDAGE